MRTSCTTISQLRSFLTSGVLLAAGLLVSVTPRAWGQFGGTFVSATPQTPITLGQPLNITVIVRNNTGDDWVAGELDASWLTEVDEPSWLPGATPIDFAYSIHTDVASDQLYEKINHAIEPPRHRGRLRHDYR